MKDETPCDGAQTGNTGQFALNIPRGVESGYRMKTAGDVVLDIT